MNIEPFLLERYYARHEFTAKYLLSSSDCQALAMTDLVAMADAESARLWQDLRLGYTETPGHPLLREAIAASYTDLSAEDVLVAAPEECIFLLMHALLKPGDHVVYTHPGYQSLHAVARSIGCEVTAWEPEEDRGWRFDPQVLQGLLRPDTRLVVWNFPHNPTGYVPPPEDFQAMLELAGGRGVHVLSDEMYRLLEVEAGSTLPAAGGRYERAISLSGTSKVYGLPGLRIGWLATRDREVLQSVVGLKDYTTICSSAPSEVLALIAIRQRERILAEQTKRVRRNMGHLDRFMADHDGAFRWNRPIGGSICFPRMTQVEDTSAFCEQLVQDTGIMLVPSEQFQFGYRHVRIGFGREDLPLVLGRFGEYLAAHAG